MRIQEINNKNLPDNRKKQKNLTNQKNNKNIIRKKIIKKIKNNLY